jgi:hypothetical protein
LYLLLLVPPQKPVARNSIRKRNVPADNLPIVENQLGRCLGYEEGSFWGGTLKK